MNKLADGASLAKSEIFVYYSGMEFTGVNPMIQLSRIWSFPEI